MTAAILLRLTFIHLHPKTYLFHQRCRSSDRLNSDGTTWGAIRLGGIPHVEFVRSALPPNSLSPFSFVAHVHEVAKPTLAILMFTAIPSVIGILDHLSWKALIQVILTITFYAHYPTKLAICYLTIPTLSKLTHIQVSGKPSVIAFYLTRSFLHF
jgi:hypothetical protein